MQQAHLTFFILISLLFSPFFSQAQDATSIVRGQVVDLEDGHPISGVSVFIDQAEDQGVQTDEQGRFRLETVIAGRHKLIAQKEGFQRYVIPDLLVNSGKETVLRVQLKELIYFNEEVQIAAATDRDLQRVSTRVFTVEESKRFAAAYFDPARMVASFPGVVQSNDQANHLIVRGNSPNGLAWRLEGVDIVNPNHLTNAGTFSDRITPSGGGTIILSTQLLANSSFSTGAFSPEFGNAIAGVFDINFREGNNENFEFTGQAGLIGIDLSAEGPINRKQGSSFLVNYRYSTVGLLDLMGVPLGDESITYQDFAFKLNFPTQKAGTFGFFGMGGLSSNDFLGARTDSVIDEQKDRFDINFISNMGAVGATHELLLGQSTLWRSVVALSAQESGRTTSFLDDTFEGSLSEDDQMLQSRLSITSNVTHKFGPQFSLKGGFYLNRIGYQLNSFFRPPGSAADFETLAFAEGASWLLQPYLDGHWNPHPRVSLRAGLHGMYFFLNESRALEPRASLSLQLSPRQTLRLAYGLHSQLQQAGTYFAAFEGPDGEILTPNTGLGFTRAHHFVASYQYQFSPQFSVRLEPYYQSLFNVPVANNPASIFSAINLFEGYVTEELVNLGTGQNYGLETTVEKLLDRNYYFLLSGSVFESTFTAADGINRPARFNGRFALSGTGGWEKEGVNRKGQQRILGLNLRTIYRGGMRALPIDLEASRAAERTVFDTSNGFTEQLPNYFRIDFRFTLKRNRANFTRTFGIDIQNVLNTQNIAFRYYDFQLDEIISKNQLGIIPLLSYRVEF
ncbi:MAG: TonB-dependent receptor [Bacteroidota bacterium]